MATELLESDLKQKSGAAASEESLVGEGHTESDELSLFDVLVILVERRRTIIWITGVCAVMAVIASLLQPKKFTATVTR